MKIAVIGAGFGGMSAAAYLAKAGHDVHVYEKNEQPGGRAYVKSIGGYTFDCGPSWYLMPDVYEEFFADFGHKVSDFYELKQLNPSYRVYEKDTLLNVRPVAAAYKDFDGIEEGAGPKLQSHLQRTKQEYEKIRKSLLPMDGLSRRQFLSQSALEFLGNPNMIRSFHARIQSVVKESRLQHILEFMVVFLGGSPHNIPAMYGLLNWVDLGQGVWYPQGGFGAVAHAFEKLAESQGVQFHYGRSVSRIVKNGDGIELTVASKKLQFDRVVANADYQYVETTLLDADDQQYPESYWQGKTLSPSAVLGLVGVKKRLPLEHHNLFFDTDWEQGFKDVFENEKPSKKPLFYLGASSRTDDTVAPRGHENLFILIPTSSKVSLKNGDAIALVDNAIDRIIEKTGDDFRENIEVKEVLGDDYFRRQFHASDGNAFGLAHTLMQSGPLRPKIRSDKVRGLYYVGQFTNPGTGVPLVVLSGKVVAKRMIKDIK